MQLIRQLAFFAFSAMLLAVQPAAAESVAKPAKTYDEVSFIGMMSNKTRQQVVGMIGEPAKKQLSVKPANADAMLLGQPLKPSKDGMKVEMWYYNNLVRYDSKNTYKTTELTFVNGRCTNVAFFNNN